MKLQLFISGKLFNEMILDPMEFLPIEFLSEEENFNYRQQRLNECVDELKYAFARQLTTGPYEIYLVVDSKINETATV